MENGNDTFKTIGQGAATSVPVATWPRLDGLGGRYVDGRVGPGQGPRT